MCRVSLNDLSIFKRLFIYKNTTHKKCVVHEKIHSLSFWNALQMFNVYVFTHLVHIPNVIQLHFPYVQSGAFVKVRRRSSGARATRRVFKLEACMYLVMYHPSLLVVYYSIHRVLKSGKSFRLTLCI